MKFSIIYYDGTSKVHEEGRSNTKGKQGIWKTYFKSGSVHFIREYRNDELHGSFKRFAENGQLLIQSTYRDDKMFGPGTEYYTSGQIKEEWIYTADGTYLVQNCWDENGNKTLSEGSGMKIEIFGPAESMIVAQHFRNGKLIREEKLKSPDYRGFTPNK